MTSVTTLAAAILIISDTVSRDVSTDQSYGILKGVFSNQTNVHWNVFSAQISPDDDQKIQSLIKGLCDQDKQNRPNLIVTTGGTGFATKDVTPEAVEPLLQKKAPGLV